MGGGSSKPATSRGVQPNAQAVPPFKIVLRNCTGLAKTDSNGLTDCYIVGRFYDLKTEKFLPKTFKSTVREKTLEPEFDEVRTCSGHHTYHIVAMPVTQCPHQWHRFT